jgi:hypothetical protein
MTATTTKRPLATGLSVLFLLLLLASLGGRFWATDRAAGKSGPTHIAADGEQVVLFAAGDLLQLAGDGELRAVIPFTRTGLAGDPIDLRFIADGRLLVVTQQPAAARLCEVTAWDCRPIAEVTTSRVERQLKILPAAEPGEWLLTDARGDTLWRLAPGQPPREAVPAGTLAGPNDLAYAADSALWVADTDHRRIVELVPDPAGGFTVGREHSALNEHTAGRAWFPMMLARAPDGRWWVTQAAEFSESRAELMVYDPEQGAQARVELPAGAWPTDVVALGDSIVVTDMDRHTAYRVASDTQAVSRFGDERLLAHLEGIRQQREYYEQFSRGSLVAVIACGILMIGAALLATPGAKRWTRLPPPFDWAGAPAEVPHVAGVHWLKRDPAFARSLQWAERLGYLLFLLPALGALILFLWIRAQAGAPGGAEAGSAVNSELREAGLTLLACTILLGLLIPLVRKSMRALRTRLGTDGRRLYIRRYDGREIAVDPAQLGYTDRMILYREHTWPLTGGKRKSVYERGEVETWLGPLLRQARRLSVGEALKHQWEHRDRRMLWWLAGGLLIAALVATALQLAPGSSAV